MPPVWSCSGLPPAPCPMRTCGSGDEGPNTTCQNAGETVIRTRLNEELGSLEEGMTACRRHHRGRDLGAGTAADHQPLANSAPDWAGSSSQFPPPPQAEQLAGSQEPGWCQPYCWGHTDGGVMGLDTAMPLPPPGARTQPQFILLSLLKLPRYTPLSHPHDTNSRVHVTHILNICQRGQDNSMPSYHLKSTISSS